jgi:hypothetical protein
MAFFEDIIDRIYSEIDEYEPSAETASSPPKPVRRTKVQAQCGMCHSAASHHGRSRKPEAESLWPRSVLRAVVTGGRPGAQRITYRGKLT